MVSAFNIEAYGNNYLTERSQLQMVKMAAMPRTQLDGESQNRWPVISIAWSDFFIGPFGS